MTDASDYIFNFELFAEKFLRIKDEQGDIVPLRFNTAQQRVAKKIKAKLDSGSPIRMIILKARQQGISTLIQAFIFWWNLTNENQKALTMGHETDASTNLFNMYKRYYDNLPSMLQPPLKKSNEKKVEYDELGSENKIDTAGDKSSDAGVGRSDTFQALHLTEVAFYPNAKTTFVGLLQGAKYAKMHFIESTANGFNDFHKYWKAAVDGESIYEPVFLSWMDFPEYIVEAKKFGFIPENPDVEYVKKTLGNPKYNKYPGEERMLLEEYGATIDQILWRRWAIDNLCDKSVDQFHQEYPRDPEEAFLSSGQPVFPSHIVHKKIIASRPPLKRGDLIFRFDDSIEYRTKLDRGQTSLLELKEHITGVEFVENPRGFVSIWTKIDPPEEGVTENYRYAGGADVAEGLAQGDYSTASYLDRKTFKTCLTWHGHIDADIFAEELYKIQLFLGSGTHVAIERNNQGLSTILYAHKLGLNMLYDQSFNRGFEVTTGSLGFRTTSKSKPIIIAVLNEWIREDYFDDYEEAFWKECQVFVRNARGQMQAEGKDRDPGVKNYDDRVMSRAIMLRCHEWLPAWVAKHKKIRGARSSVGKPMKVKGSHLKF